MNRSSTLCGQKASSSCPDAGRGMENPRSNSHPLTQKGLSRDESIPQSINHFSLASNSSPLKVEPKLLIAHVDRALEEAPFFLSFSLLFSSENEARGLPASFTPYPKTASTRPSYLGICESASRSSVQHRSTGSVRSFRMNVRSYLYGEGPNTYQRQGRS